MLSVTTAGMLAGFCSHPHCYCNHAAKNDVPKNAFVLLAIGAFLIAGQVCFAKVDRLRSATRRCSQ